jgi:hypothetical protein
LDTLRTLLIQRAARLQEWPAVTAGDWGTLRYPAFRNRVEGVALGLMAAAPTLGTPFHSRQGGPWDWACEVACACCGLRWDPAGSPVDAALLGGPRFNDEGGRQAYHDRDHDLDGDTPFLGGLTHGELGLRLRRLNGKLGWDHATAVTLPLDQLGTPEVRGALWSVLFAGGHAVIQTGMVKGWDPEPFGHLFGA